MLLDTYFHLISCYFMVMRGVRLKWRRLLFWYTLSCFDLNTNYYWYYWISKSMEPNKSTKPKKIMKVFI